MVEIIPAILAYSFEEFEAAVRRLEGHVERVHVDVADGIFVPTKTISGHEELARIQTTLKFDVHLMVHDPLAQCEHWWPDHADRFWAHVESVPDFPAFVARTKEHGKQCGAVLNPDSDVAQLEPALRATNLVQFMTVQPGAQARPFLSDIPSRIAQFHAAHPDVRIAVDGGIRPETAPHCVAAGASILVSGSYLLQAPDIAEALTALRASVVH